MNELTNKQKNFIEKHHHRFSAVEMSRRIKVPLTVVEAYVATLTSPSARMKSRAFRLLAALIPVLFFILLEGVLRLFNYGPRLDIFSSLENDTRYWVTNHQVGRRYFFVKDLAPATSYDAILKEKPANGCRIFVLGGSTAAGFPYFHNGAFSRMLATRLEDALPNRQIEVVNLAMPAVNSYTVLDFMDELVDYEPDAFLIYAGHNEFYGALGISSTEVLGQYRGLVNLVIRLQHSKVFYLLRSFIGWVKAKSPGGGDQQRPENATLMERMVGNKQIRFGSDEYHKAVEIFEQNLLDIIGIARASKVPILLSELVCNIRDQVPFESVYKTGKRPLAWNDLFNRGRQFQKAGRFEEALNAFRKAAELDDGVAGLHFQVARSLHASGKPAAARAAFYRAKDLDALRFRASEDFNRTIHQVAAKHDVPVVRMKHYFEAASPDSLIGTNLMLEHLHPNLKGYFQMTLAFFDAMIEHDLPAAQWDTATIGSDDEYWQRLELTPVDLEVAKIKTDVLMSGWPFKRGGEPNFASEYQPANKMQEVAYEVFRDKKNWEQSHVDLAEFYAKNKQLARAAAEYRALVRGTPYNLSPYLRLGLLYLEMQDFAASANIFEKSLRVNESAIANKWLGSIHVNAGNPERGLPFLQRALRVQPDDPETLYNLTVALAKMGEFGQAQANCQVLLKSYPDHPGLTELWAKIKDR